MNDFDTSVGRTFPPTSTTSTLTDNTQPHFLHLFVPRQWSVSSEPFKTLAMVQRESEARWATYSLAGYTVEFVQLLNKAQREQSTTNYDKICTLVKGSHFERKFSPYGHPYSGGVER